MQAKCLTNNNQPRVTNLHGFAAQVNQYFTHGAFLYVRLNGVFSFRSLLKSIMHRIANFARKKNCKSAKHVKIIEF